MAEYIKREAAVDAASAVYYDTPDINLSAEKFEAAINAIPAADVAEVVRCKDCKHYRNHPNGLCYLHTEPKTNARGYSGNAVCVEPDDSCSYGERKDGGERNV